MSQPPQSSEFPQSLEPSESPQSSEFPQSPEIRTNQGEIKAQVPKQRLAELMPENPNDLTTLPSIKDHDLVALRCTFRVTNENPNPSAAIKNELPPSAHLIHLPDTIDAIDAIDATDTTGALQENVIIIAKQGDDTVKARAAINSRNTITTITTITNTSEGYYRLGDRLVGQGTSSTSPRKPTEVATIQPPEALNGCAKFYGKIHLGNLNPQFETNSLNEITKLAQQHRIFICRTGRDTQKEISIEFLLVDEKPAEAIAFLDNVKRHLQGQQTSFSALLTYTQAPISDPHQGPPIQDPQARKALMKKPPTGEIWLDQKTAILASDVRALRARATTKTINKSKDHMLLQSVQHFPTDFSKLEGTIPNPSHNELETAIKNKTAKVIKITGPAGSGKSTAVRAILPQEDTSRVNGLSERNPLAPFERMVTELLKTMHALQGNSIPDNVRQAITYLDAFTKRQNPQITFQFDITKFAKAILICKNAEAIFKKKQTFLYFDDPDRLDQEGQQIFQKIQELIHQFSMSLKVHVVFSERNDINQRSANEESTPSDPNLQTITVTDTTITKNNVKIEELNSMVAGVIKRYKLHSKLEIDENEINNIDVQIEVINTAAKLAKMTTDENGTTTGSPHNFAIAIEALIHLGVVEARTISGVTTLSLNTQKANQNQERITALTTQGDIYSSQLSTIDTSEHHYAQVIHLALLCNGMAENLFLELLYTDSDLLAAYTEVKYREIITVQGGVIHTSNKWQDAVTYTDANIKSQAETALIEALSTRWTQSETTDLCLLFDLKKKHNQETNDDLKQAAAQEALEAGKFKTAYEISQQIQSTTKDVIYLQLRAATLAGQTTAAASAFSTIRPQFQELTPEQKKRVYIDYLNILAQTTRTTPNEANITAYQTAITQTPQFTPELQNLQALHQANINTIQAVNAKEETIRKIEETIRKIEALLKQFNQDPSINKTWRMKLHINLQTLYSELIRYQNGGEDYQAIQEKIQYNNQVLKEALEKEKAHGKAARQILIETGGIETDLSMEAQINLRIASNVVRTSKSPHEIEQALNRFTEVNDQLDNQAKALNLLQLTGTLGARISVDPWLHQEDSEDHKTCLSQLRIAYHLSVKKAEETKAYPKYIKFNKAEAKILEATTSEDKDQLIQEANTLIIEVKRLWEDNPSMAAEVQKLEEKLKTLKGNKTQIANEHQLYCFSKTQLPLPLTTPAP